MSDLCAVLDELSGGETVQVLEGDGDLLACWRHAHEVAGASRHGLPKDFPRTERRQ
jgi:hypothetical protein